MLLEPLADLLAGIHKHKIVLPGFSVHGFGSYKWLVIGIGDGDMGKKGKQLSNPFSTGGGGLHFEAHVQASFVVLMLTGGFAPFAFYGCIICMFMDQLSPIT